MPVRSLACGLLAALQLCSSTPLPGQWESLPPVPFGPRPVEVFAFGDQAVAIGPPWQRQPEHLAVAVLEAGRQWATAPAPPIQERQHVYMRAVGNRLVVFGGLDDKTGTWRNDGALFDPRARRWTAMAPCPIPGRCSFAIADDGAHLAIVGGAAPIYERVGEDYVTRPGPRREAAVFDVPGNRWQRLPDLPIAPRNFAQLTWAGDQLIVWGGWDANSPDLVVPLADGAVWKAGDTAWRVLPEAPAAQGSNPATAANDGRRALFFARTIGWHADGSVLDLDRLTWRAMPRRVDFGVSPGICYAHGDRLLLYSGRLTCTKPPEHDAWLWSTATGEWQQLQLPDGFHPRETPGTASAGPRCAILGGARTTALHVADAPTPPQPDLGKRCGDGIVVDLALGSLTYVPEGPLGLPEEPAIAFWRGGLLVVGGHAGKREWSAAAATFALPR